MFCFAFDFGRGFISQSPLWLHPCSHLIIGRKMLFSFHRRLSGLQSVLETKLSIPESSILQAERKIISSSNNSFYKTKRADVHSRAHSLNTTHRSEDNRLGVTQTLHNGFPMSPANKLWKFSLFCHRYLTQHHSNLFRNEESPV